MEKEELFERRIAGLSATLKRRRSRSEDVDEAAAESTKKRANRNNHPIRKHLKRTRSEEEEVGPAKKARASLPETFAWTAADAIYARQKLHWERFALTEQYAYARHVLGLAPLADAHDEEKSAPDFMETEDDLVQLFEQLTLSKRQALTLRPTTLQSKTETFLQDMVVLCHAVGLSDLLAYAAGSESRSVTVDTIFLNFLVSDRAKDALASPLFAAFQARKRSARADFYTTRVPLDIKVRLERLFIETCNSVELFFLDYATLSAQERLYLAVMVLASDPVLPRVLFKTLAPLAQLAEDTVCVAGLHWLDAWNLARASAPFVRAAVPTDHSPASLAQVLISAFARTVPPDPLYPEALARLFGAAVPSLPYLERDALDDFERRLAASLDDDLRAHETRQTLEDFSRANSAAIEEFGADKLACLYFIATLWRAEKKNLAAHGDVLHHLALLVPGLPLPLLGRGKNAQSLVLLALGLLSDKSAWIYDYALAYPSPNSVLGLVLFFPYSEVPRAIAAQVTFPLAHPRIDPLFVIRRLASVGAPSDETRALTFRLLVKPYMAVATVDLCHVWRATDDVTDLVLHARFLNRHCHPMSAVERPRCSLFDDTRDAQEMRARLRDALSRPRDDDAATLYALVALLPLVTVGIPTQAFFAFMEEVRAPYLFFGRDARAHTILLECVSTSASDAADRRALHDMSSVLMAVWMEANAGRDTHAFEAAFALLRKRHADLPRSRIATLSALDQMRLTGTVKPALLAQAAQDMTLWCDEHPDLVADALLPVVLGSERLTVTAADVPPCRALFARLAATFAATRPRTLLHLVWSLDASRVSLCFFLLQEIASAQSVAHALQEQKRKVQKQWVEAVTLVLERILAVLPADALLGLMSDLATEQKNPPFILRTFAALPAHRVRAEPMTPARLIVSLEQAAVWPEEDGADAVYERQARANPVLTQLLNLYRA